MRSAFGSHGRSPAPSLYAAHQAMSAESRRLQLTTSTCASRHACPALHVVPHLPYATRGTTASVDARRLAHPGQCHRHSRLAQDLIACTAQTSVELYDAVVSRERL